MLVRYADWKKPTDAAYAFRLRARDAFVPAVPPRGATRDIRLVAREVLDDGEAERFEARVRRWSGPEDVVGPDGEKPYEMRQLLLHEGAWRERLTMADVDRVLRGTVLVLRRAGGPVDYVLRDHHMLDVALDHYRCTGELPRALFHADRHSDWCKDSFLEARVPEQAATWWRLFEGLKRPGDGAPVLREEDVYFTSARAAPRDGLSGRDVGASGLVPWFLSAADLPWERALERPGALDCDWVSLDLDDFQPSPQLALTKGLLRDPRLHGLLSAAKVRVFVLSPQFTNGGEKIPEWTIQGRLHSTLRLLNLVRNLPRGVWPR